MAADGQSGSDAGAGPGDTGLGDSGLGAGADADTPDADTPDAGGPVAADAAGPDATLADAGEPRCNPSLDWELYKACCDEVNWDFHQGCMAWGPPAPPAGARLAELMMDGALTGAQEVV